MKPRLPNPTALTQRSCPLFYRVVCLALTVILVSSLLTEPVRAANKIYRVAPNGIPSGECGMDWEKACSLQHALIDLAIKGDELWVKTGIYKPTTEANNASATFQLRSDIALYGGFSGNETQLDQRQWWTFPTTLSGDLDNNGRDSGDSYHVVTASGTNASAILDGFTITGGNANGASFPLNNGGGILSSGGSPTLRNLDIRGNFALSGGGISIDYSSPVLTNTTFSNNSAEYGGALSNNSDWGQLNNVTFRSNSAIQGGAIYNTNEGTLFILHATFSNNTASESGGALFMVNTAYFYVRNSIFWGNTASQGSQVYAYNSLPTISNSIIQGGCPGNTSCSGILTGDPKLASSLATVAQGVPVLALTGSSAAINMGNISYCLPTDARGLERRINGTVKYCDLGAYEAQPASLVAASGSGQTAVINKSFNELRVSALDSYGNQLKGVVVALTAPSSGASANLSPTPATTGSSGYAHAAATANGIAGSYHVTARRGALAAYFALTNAAVLYVKPAGSGDCFSWTTACELTTALDKSDEGVEVWVQAGSYRPSYTDLRLSFVQKEGVALYGGFNGTETSRTQRDWTLHFTYLSGDGNNNGPANSDSYHILKMENAGSTTILDGFLIEGAYARGPAEDGIGGGLFLINSNPVLQNLYIYGNKADKGAGIYCVSGHPSLRNIVFHNNQAAQGAGIYNQGCLLSLTNVYFSSNTADLGSILYNESQTASLVHTTISRNTGSPVVAGPSTSLIDIRNSVFTDNTPENLSSSGPGAIQVSDSIMQGDCPSNVSCTNVLDQDPLIRMGSFGEYYFPAAIPAPGSPAIDFIPNEKCIFLNDANPQTPLTFDLRGVARQADAGCDAGAFESRGFHLTIVSGNDQIAEVSTPLEPLVVSVSSDYNEPVAGGMVTFTLAGPGAGTTVPFLSAVIDSSSQASASFTANSQSGSYAVTASARGAASPVQFHLANRISKTFCFLPHVVR